MKMLNLGCGNRFHSDWINLDMSISDDSVIEHNLLEPLPFDAGFADAVYHSHVLEHFPKAKAKKFLADCFRVLRSGGILRVAIPDLEQIARLYLQNLEAALNNKHENAASNYDWIMLELYDQTVRDQSGGEMGIYLTQKQLPNKKFILDRLGAEAKSIFGRVEHDRGHSNSRKKSFLRRIRRFKLRSFLKNLVLTDAEKDSIRIGEFRLGGEVHQWMYDRFSLGRLLKDVGFSSIEVVDAFTSQIPNWKSYELDSQEGIIHKPDSLFVEAIK
jgi:predicted SAM-dependent methyltransferase